MCFFFFSSRRRHTRFDCDWSSDVCSSDLVRRNRSGRKGERGSVIPRIVPTPIARLEPPTARATPRRVAPEVVASTLPGPGRDRLAGDAVLAVTTGQQPGLVTGPPYTISKAVSANAPARPLQRERGGARV